MSSRTPLFLPVIAELNAYINYSVDTSYNTPTLHTHSNTNNSLSRTLFFARKGRLKNIVNNEYIDISIHTFFTTEAQ